MHNTKRLKQGLFALLTTLLLNSPLAHSVVIGFEPNPFFASTGDSIALNLVVSDLGNFAPDSLGAFDISVGFDPSVFAFTNYTLGGYLGDLGLFEALDVSFGDLGGSVNLAEVSLLSGASLDALQPGAFTLATLNFNVLDLDVGAVYELSILQGAILGNADGDPLEARVGAAASIEGVESTVPISGTLELLIAALFGLFLLHSRRLLYRRIEAFQ